MRHPQHWYFPQFRCNMRKISAKRYRRPKLLKRCSQLQRVWGSVAASCSQLQISDSVRYFLRRSVTLQVVAACMMGSCKLQVQEPMKKCFTPFIFSPMRACRSIAYASRHSVYVLQFKILATAHCSQLLLVCGALYRAKLSRSRPR